MSATNTFSASDLTALPQRAKDLQAASIPLGAERSGDGGDRATDGYLTLAQATKIAPGRPSINCVWRWCRRGVMSRSGDRIRLTHIRAGGKLFTRAVWLDEFGRRLAEADAQHFDRDLEDDRDGAAVVASPPRKRSSHDQQSHDRHEAIARELERQGL